MAGMLPYVVTASNLPFDEPSLPVLFKKIARADYPVPTWFSPDMISLFKSMLNPNPQKRCTMLLWLSKFEECPITPQSP